MAAWPGTGDLLDRQEMRRPWVEDNNACRLDTLAAPADGPLPTSELPDTCVRLWAPSGRNNNKNLTMMLGFLELELQGPRSLGEAP